MRSAAIARSTTWQLDGCGFFEQEVMGLPMNEFRDCVFVCERLHDVGTFLANLMPILSAGELWWAWRSLSKTSNWTQPRDHFAAVALQIAEPSPGVGPPPKPQP